MRRRYLTEELETIIISTRNRAKSVVVERDSEQQKSDGECEQSRGKGEQ